MLDEIIVGQGLIGSLLAWRLIEAGHRVLVIDDGERENASRVAAGLVNPLAGRRLRPPAGLEAARAAGQRVWRRLEQHFGQPFFHPLPMLRLFNDPAQAMRHAELRADPALRRYAGPRLDTSRLPQPHGGFVQRHTGWLDTGALLDALGAWLARHDALRRELTHAREFQARADMVRWRDLRARRVIFCEGWRMRDNPWFDWLPLQPAKGEILDLALPEAAPRAIVNGGCWAIPLGDGRLRFGASNRWCFDDDRPEPAARAWLLAEYRRLCGRQPPKVLAQRAGIRPGTPDRQPFLGCHPYQPRLWVCNGFGARGALFAPLHVEALTRRLCAGQPLPAAIDISRYRKRLDASG